jgi:plasmid stabilization system protein ParE
VARLRDFPEIGAVVEVNTDPAFREIVFQEQRILYHYDGTMILILTVFHGSHTPDLSRLLGK